jgi:hypothetical protein
MRSFVAGVFPHSLIVLVALPVFACGFGTGAAGQGENRTSETEWRGYNGGYDATRFFRLRKSTRPMSLPSKK